MIWLSLALATAPTVPTQDLAIYGVGDGSDGSLTINPATEPEPPAYGRLAINGIGGRSDLELVDASEFEAGDLVLIWQVTGPEEPEAGDPYVDLEGAGLFQLRRIDAVAGNLVTLDGPLAAPFPADHTQVVQVLEFEDLSILPNVTVPVPPWNGSTGGILFATVSGTFDNQGLVDGRGSGFRGGASEEGLLAFGCDGLDNGEAGRAGEGLHGTSSKGAGNRGSSGGGGNCHNAGGAGGAHLGAGGGGGEAYDFGRDVGGLGGAPLDPPVFLPDRLYLGSGGGGGHTSSGDRSGHPGGGVVVIIADTVVTFGAVDVSGDGGGGAGEDGGGGGGAGGTAVLISMDAAECDAVRADGGAGMNSDDDLIGTCTGPGGGGGGGLIYVSPTPLGSCVPQSLGGGNGICDGRTNAGADPGTDGLVWLRPETDLDADGDGSPVWEDCQDGDPRVTPGSMEICDNGVDDDCDPTTLDSCPDTADTGLTDGDADTDADTDTDADADADTDADVDSGLDTGGADAVKEPIVAGGACNCRSGTASLGWLPALLAVVVARRRS